LDQHQAKRCKEQRGPHQRVRKRRHQFQGNAFDNRKLTPLEDQDVEADEMFQNAGLVALYRDQYEKVVQRRD